MTAFNGYKNFTAYCPVCAAETPHYKLFSGKSYCVPCEAQLAAEMEAKILAHSQKERRAQRVLKEEALLKKTGVRRAHLDAPSPQLARYRAEIEAFKTALLMDQKSPKGPKGQNASSVRWLLLYGAVGTGKTTLALKLLFEAQNHGLGVSYLHGYELERFKSDELETCRLLVIDELHLAVRMFGDRPADEDRRRLYQLISQIKQHNIALIALTNYGKNGLTECLGAEIIDRLSDKHQTFCLEFSGTSFRQKLC